MQIEKKRAAMVPVSKDLLPALIASLFILIISTPATSSSEAVPAVQLSAT